MDEIIKKEIHFLKMFKRFAVAYGLGLISEEYIRKLSDLDYKMENLNK